MFSCCSLSSPTRPDVFRKLTAYALRNRAVVLAALALAAMAGFFAFRRLPVEAYPDVANNYVQVITQWPGRAAEEVEQQVSIPIDVAPTATVRCPHCHGYI